jgi:putative restriction endonuclease
MTADTRSRTRDLGHLLADRLDEAANEHGFRIQKGEAAGWRFYGSATAPREIALGAAGFDGPFFLSVEHQGVAMDMSFPEADPPARGHSAAYVFLTRDDFFRAVKEVYRKAVSLPTHPLELFRKETAMLGDTESERTQRVRIGQGIFRESLLDYWSGFCPMTGITNPELLRASHIIPWAKCESDEERLNVYNGLLLSSLWDAAFDAGLLTFNDGGEPLLSRYASVAARRTLSSESVPPLPLHEEHQIRLAWHRAEIFQG